MNVSSVTNHFSTANKGFITTLGSSILSGATTVPLTSVSGLTNGTVFVGIIEPGLPNEQEFTGTVDTAGVQLTGVKWTDGTNVDHTAGVTIVDYVAATDWNMQTKGLLVSHDQDGTLKAGSVDNVAVIADDIITPAKFTDELKGGWAVGEIAAPTAVTANGNRSYTLTHASSIASTISPGMRRRFTRTVAGPTTAFSLDGSNDYYVKTSPSGMTFTDDFVVSAWVYLTAYQAGTIASRYNGTSGWMLDVYATGQVRLMGLNGGGSNYSQVVSYQSLPLNRWVHVTAQLDMSTFTATTTTSYVMLDGKDIPVSVARGGTNPTALIQAGNLEIGTINGGLQPLAGYIDQVAIYNAKVTQATILASKDQALTGSETSLISAYSNGSVTDLSANANNLTATNGATTVSSSWHGNRGVSSTLEYALTMSVSSDGLTEVVQVPEGCALPTTGGITASAYSTMANPYGWVSDKGRWEVVTLGRTDVMQAAAVNGTWYNLGSIQIYIPVGSWRNTYYAAVYRDTGGFMEITLSTANNTESDTAATGYFETSGGAVSGAASVFREIALNQTVAGTLYLNTKSYSGVPNLYNFGARAATTIKSLPNGL
jgi:hypothetical protein